MKRKITILLATGIIVILVAFSLVFVKAASSHRADVLRASSDNYAAVRASAGKHSDSDQVGASVPPEYHYDPINAIYIRDDGKDDHLFEGESVKLTKVDDKHYQYVFKDLKPNGRYKFHICVNDNMGDRFGRGQDVTDYGFDYPTRVFRYPPGYNPQSNEVNLTENNITIPPDGFSYDATLVLDLSEYNEDNPGDVYAYAVYTITLERKYRIKSEADWNTFCDRLAENESYNRFSGDTLYLENDITVSRPAGSANCDFCGIFDGQGHTLTFNYSGSSEFAAPFSFVSVTVPLGSKEGTPDAPVTIKNLNVKSTIRSSGKHAAGLIGQCWGEVNVENCTMDIDIETDKVFAAGYVGKINNRTFSISRCTVGGTIKTSAMDAAGFVAETSGVCNITDCLSGLTIVSSVNGDGTHGGFVGVQNRASNDITMKGCVFNGKLLGADTNSCGGFIGSKKKTSRSATVSLRLKR